MTDEQALRDIVAEERAIDRRAGRLATTLSLVGFIGTAVLIVGGWIWWGSSQAALLTRTVERVDAVERLVAPLVEGAIRREERVRSLEERGRVVDEKIERIGADISEIKGDMKVLLRRTGR